MRRLEQVFTSREGDFKVIKHLIVWTVLLSAIVLPNQVGAQEFKISSLFPFKKQTQEIKPIQLTDHAGGLNNTASGPWNTFSQKSKDFFSRTGEGISNFTSNMRDSLKNMESPGWQFDKKSHWWNDQPDMAQLRHEFDLLNRQSPQAGQPPRPQPRTANGLQTTPPRYRF